MTAETNLTRTTINLTPKAVESLDHLIARFGTSKTDVINRALMLSDFINGEIAAGRQILVRATDGATETLRII